MSDDLFDIPDRGARARRDDPDTSHAAAAVIDPHVGLIRERVEDYAKARGAEGFIDEELSAFFEGKDSSSHRTRRSELTDRNIILDSTQRRSNSRGHSCIVWVHRDFVAQPPAEGGPMKPTSRDISEALATLEGWARQMRNEGRCFVGHLENAIETVKRSLAR